jgi:hypothetical protein
MAEDISEANYAHELELQEQEELEDKQTRIDNFKSWLNKCPENIYVVVHDDKPTDWWWCEIQVKSDISLDEWSIK